MIIPISESTQRKAATDVLIKLIEKLSEGNGNVENIIVLKSCVFISIYNSIEAMTYICLESIHEECRRVGFSELTDEIREISLKYYLAKNHVDKEVKNIELLAANEKIPSLFEYIKKKPIFSGNLDLRKINVIFSSYGIDTTPLTKGESESILWVKNKRNKIAHGEQTMFDAGQQIKTSRLIFANEASSKLIISMTENCNKFIREEKYKSRKEINFDGVAISSNMAEIE